MGLLDEPQLRVKKYLKLISRSGAIEPEAAGSKGSLMLTPNEFSIPAAVDPASMIPGPAPVMMSQPFWVMSSAKR